MFKKVLIAMVSLTLFIAPVLYFGSAISFAAQSSPHTLEATNSLYLYKTLPGAQKSQSYDLTVEDQSVFVEKYKDISYARFSFNGTISISVSIPENIVSYNISPHSYQIQADVQENKLIFSLAKPEKLIVTVNQKEKLFIFADPKEENPPQIGAAGVFSLLNYPGIDPDGNVINTAQIQHAIDSVYAAGGGILYFPNGKYLTGMIRIRSKVTIYLQDGALLQGTDDISAYENPIRLSDGSNASVATLICFENAENAKLTGRGVVDGSGQILRGKGLSSWLTFVNASKNITVEDVILRDPAAFNTHIRCSDDVTYQRVKLINDINVPNTDGIDPDSSRHILIDDIFAYTSDDCVSVKNSPWYTSYIQDTYDITVKNSVFWTKKSSLKLGYELAADKTYDIFFVNNDIIHADRALVIYVMDGSDCSNIQFINNRAEYIGGDLEKRLIHFYVKKRDETRAVGSIKNVVIKDFYAESFSPNPSKIEGFDQGHLIENVIIDNMVVAGIQCRSLTDARIQANGYVKNIQFGEAPSLYSKSAPPRYFDNGIFVEENGAVAIEAEHYKKDTERNNHQWAFTDETMGYSGMGTVRSIPDNNMRIDDNLSSISPQMEYRISFEEAGRYYFWSRSFTKSTSSDSFYIGIESNGFSWTSSMGVYTLNGWYWNNRDISGQPVYVDIPNAGEYTFYVWMREDGISLDKYIFLKTQDASELPSGVTNSHTGLGPKESQTKPFFTQYDFEKYSIHTDMTATEDIDWQKAGNSSGSAVVIQDILDASNKCLKFMYTNDSAEPTVLNLPLSTECNGRVILDYKFLIMDRAKKVVANFKNESDHDVIMIIAENYTISLDRGKTVPLLQNAWNHLRLVMDTDTDKYDVYINNLETPVAVGIDLLLPAAYFSKFGIQIDSGQMNIPMYIDELCIFREEEIVSPVLILPSGDGTSVRLLSDEGVIYYTTDRTIPTEQSTVYQNQSLSLSSVTTIKAFVKKDGFYSIISSFCIDVNPLGQGLSCIDNKLMKDGRQINTIANLSYGDIIENLVTVYKSDNDKQSFVVLLCLYKGTELQQMKCQTFEVTDQLSTRSLTLNLLEASLQDCRIKSYVWNSVENMRSLCTPQEVK